MTDNQLLNLLGNIKKHCTNHKTCYNCIFGIENTVLRCQVMNLVDELHTQNPTYWDMNEIERIIEK